MKSEQSELEVWTVGHSTRSIEELVELLRAHGIQRVVDVRTVPRSRTNPQFNRETLPDSLALAHIRYEHVPELGGLRRARPDSANTGWENESFRGYADHMQTESFAAGLARLEELAGSERVAIMCAEAVHWRCHRRMIADALLVRGARVNHIATATRAAAHELTPFARVEGTRLSYPAPVR